MSHSDNITQLPRAQQYLTWSKPVFGRTCQELTGVSLQQQRSRWDDEVKSDGGKAKLHRQVRHQGKADTRRLVREEC